MANPTLMTSPFKPHVSVMDEAVTGTLSDQIMPFAIWPRSIMLASFGGDCKQLAAVSSNLFKNEASDHIKESLFTKAIVAGDPVVFTLRTQYRVRGDANVFLSSVFYDQGLITPPEVRNRTSPHIEHTNKKLAPLKHIWESRYGLLFVDCSGKSQRHGDTFSMKNSDEAKMVSQVARYLCEGAPEGYVENFGAISTYRAQSNLIQTMMIEGDSVDPKKTQLSKCTNATSQTIQGEERGNIVVSWVNNDPEKIWAMGRTKHAQNMCVLLTNHNMLPSSSELSSA
jgi:superfamily I DNA and/or RNA helicase